MTESQTENILIIKVDNTGEASSSDCPSSSNLTKEGELTIETEKNKEAYKKLSKQFDPNLGLVPYLHSLKDSYNFLLPSMDHPWNRDSYFLKFLPQSSIDVPDDCIWVIGGLDPRHPEDFMLSSSIFEFNLNSQMWRFYGSMFHPRCYQNVSFIAPFMYITGGCCPLQRRDGEMLAVPYTDRLDIRTAIWTRCADMKIARASHAMVAFGKHLYVFGGRNSLGRIAESVEMYDTEADIWTEISQLPHPSMGLSAVPINDEVWILGGITGDKEKSVMPDIYRFIPSTNIWLVEKPLPYPCAFLSVVSSGDSIWAVGGAYSSKETLVSCPYISRLKLESNNISWKKVASLSASMHSICTALVGKEIYVFGGIQSDRLKATKSVEIYDTETGILRKGVRLPVAVSGSSCLFFDKKTLVPLVPKLVKRITLHKNLSGKPLLDEKNEIQSRVLASNKPEIHGRHQELLFPNSLHSSKMKRRSFKDIPQSMIQRNDDTEERLSDSNISTCETDDLKSWEDKSLKLQQYNSHSPQQEEPGTIKGLHETSISKLPTELGIIIKIDNTNTFSSSNSLLSSELTAEERLAKKNKKEKRTYIRLPKQFDPNLGLVPDLQPLESPYKIKRNQLHNRTSFFLNKLAKSDCDLNECILLLGGLNPYEPEDFELSCSIFEFHLSSQMWHYFGSMPEPKCYHAVCCSGSFLYVTGGYCPLQRRKGEMLAVPFTDRLDIRTTLWKRCADMKTARASHAMVAMGKRLYVFGGRNSLGSLTASLEIYDTQTDIWLEIATLPHPTMGLSAICANNQVWIIGGITEEIEKKVTSDVYTFILSSKSWQQKKTIPYSLAFVSCVSSDDAIWVVGGAHSSKETLISCPCIFRLDLRSERAGWQKVATLSDPKHSCSTVLCGKELYVLGGLQSEHRKVSNTVEIFNTETGTLRKGVSLPAPITGSSSIYFGKKTFDIRFQVRKRVKRLIQKARADFAEKLGLEHAKRIQESLSSITTTSLDDSKELFNSKSKQSCKIKNGSFENTQHSLRERDVDSVDYFDSFSDVNESDVSKSSQENLQEIISSSQQPQYRTTKCHLHENDKHCIDCDTKDSDTKHCLRKIIANKNRSNKESPDERMETGAALWRRISPKKQNSLQDTDHSKSKFKGNPKLYPPDTHHRQNNITNCQLHEKDSHCIYCDSKTAHNKHYDRKTVAHINRSSDELPNKHRQSEAALWRGICPMKQISAKDCEHLSSSEKICSPFQSSDICPSQQSDLNMKCHHHEKDKHCIYCEPKNHHTKHYHRITAVHRSRSNEESSEEQRQKKAALNSRFDPRKNISTKDSKYSKSAQKVHPRFQSLNIYPSQQTEPVCLKSHIHENDNNCIYYDHQYNHTKPYQSRTSAHNSKLTEESSDKQKKATLCRRYCPTDPISTKDSGKSKNMYKVTLNVPLREKESNRIYNISNPESMKTEMTLNNMKWKKLEIPYSNSRPDSILENRPSPRAKLRSPKPTWKNIVKEEIL